MSCEKVPLQESSCTQWRTKKKKQLKRKGSRKTDNLTVTWQHYANDVTAYGRDRSSYIISCSYWSHLRRRRIVRDLSSCRSGADVLRDIRDGGRARRCMEPVVGECFILPAANLHMLLEPVTPALHGSNAPLCKYNPKLNQRRFVQSGHNMQCVFLHTKCSSSYRAQCGSEGKQLVSYLRHYCAVIFSYLNISKWSAWTYFERLYIILKIHDTPLYS